LYLIPRSKASEPKTKRCFKLNSKSIIRNLKILRSQDWFAEYDEFALMTEGLLLLTNSLTTLLPILFPFAVMYEQREPLHRFLIDYLELHPRLDLKFGIPFAIFVGYITMQIANTISFVENNHQLYCQLVHGWNKFFIGQLGQRRIDSVSFSFTRKDLGFVSSYRKLQVFHRIANNVFGSDLFAVHHGTMMVLGIICFFVLIRLHKDFNLLPLTFVVFGAMASLVVPFVEFYMQSELRENSEELARQVRLRYGRNTIMSKFVRSFWLVSLETGLPFYTVERDTTISFVDKMLEFLIDLLLSSSR